jgi:hypothetical protein
MLTTMAGTSFSAVFPVLRGDKTWRDGGFNAATFVPRGTRVRAGESSLHLGLLPLSR